MAVPEQIRMVERPRNTVVVDSGSDSLYRYAVRERKGVVHEPGRNAMPINGKVIGHIIDMKYVPLAEKAGSNGPYALSWGPAAFANSVSGDILHDLVSVYDIRDAYSMISLATLRILYPNAGSDRMSTHYGRSFTSIYYPGAALSKNSITSLYNRIGMDKAKRLAFFSKRIEKVQEEHHVAIDGTLKQDTSKVNDLSGFSYKAKKKGIKEISVIYAYDIELMEPICAQVFPGNSPDSASYRKFISGNGLKKGIIVDDKGFPPDRIREELGKSPGLHYLTPIKRNDNRIREYRMTEWTGTFSSGRKTLNYKKAKTKEGKYLYAFMDCDTARAEEKTFLKNEDGSQDEGFYGKWTDMREKAGLIVFESDIDMAAETAYRIYDERWLAGLVFKAYKSDECNDETDVQGDFAVAGAEFVCFLSTVITCRMIRKATASGLLDEMSYSCLMDELKEVWRQSDAPAEAATDDGTWELGFEYNFYELEKLGLVKPGKKPSKPGSKHKKSRKKRKMA